MRKSSTNQLTVLNALASFLYNSMLGKLRAMMGYYSLNTPVMLSSQISTLCYLWSSFTSLLIFNLVNSLFKSFYFPSLRIRLCHTACSRHESWSTATWCPTQMFCDTYTGFLAALCAKSLQSCSTTTAWTSPPGSSVCGILQARILEWGCHALLEGIFPTQGSNPHLLDLLHWHSYTPLPLAPPGKH